MSLKGVSFRLLDTGPTANGDAFQFAAAETGAEVVEDSSIACDGTEYTITDAVATFEAQMRAVSPSGSVAQYQWYERVTSGTDTGGAYVGTEAFQSNVNRSVAASNVPTARCAVDATGTTKYLVLRLKVGGSGSNTWTNEASYAYVEAS